MTTNTHGFMLKRLLATTLIWGSVSFLTFVLFLVMLLLTALTFPFDTVRRRQHSQCFWWSDAVISANRYWNVTVLGLEHINFNRACVIVANHQSLADIVMLFQTRMQFKWIAKDSLFRTPVLGWCLSLAKHVRLKRNELSSIRKSYQEASAWIDRGVSVMFFPEGTRSESGELQDFRNGAFKLAFKTKVAVLPIAIHGTVNAMPKGKWFSSSHGAIRMTVLPLLEPDDFQSRGADGLKKAAWEMIHNALAVDQPSGSEGPVRHSM